MTNSVSEVTSGIRSVLSVPFVYSLYQKIVFPRDKLIRDYIKPYAGQKVLDIGCGTGNIIEYLPEVEYLGIDASLEYVQKARHRFAHRGTFQHVGVKDLSLPGKKDFDIALAIGVLHHISDEEAFNLFCLAKSALKPGGRLIAVEPCYGEGQSFLARWIISKDRGQNIKDKPGYENLVNPYFKKVNYHVRHDLLRIPYTLVVIECFV
ncbi:MAG: methyltransferase domain-containing protein [Gammaproteobacteria bacterium]|nr:methyltransferase domain-containing protein [Gammaproteobacteria bacterium]